MNMEQNLDKLAELVGDALQQHGLMLVTAESCTGGWVAQAVTSVSGCSHWFDRGFVTYTNLSKQEMLGVRAETLTQHGAVSEQTVAEMVTGALKHSHAQLALAISGIAGPGGGSLEKPVGTVCFAWGGTGFDTLTQQVHFNGHRNEVRAQAVATALQGVLKLLDS